MDIQTTEFDRTLIEKNWRDALAYDAIAMAQFSSRQGLFGRVSSTSISFDPQEHMATIMFIKHFQLTDDSQIQKVLQYAIDYAVWHARTNYYPAVILAFVFFALMSFLCFGVIDGGMVALPILAFLLLMYVLITAILGGKKRYISGLFKRSKPLTGNHSTPKGIQEFLFQQEIKNLCIACELQERSVFSFILKDGNKGYFILFVLALIIFAVGIVAWSLGWFF